MSKVAVLLDGGYVRKALRLRGLNGEDPVLVRRVANLCVDPGNIGDSLFRIYYYDCLPSSKQSRNPVSKNRINFATTQHYLDSMAFIDALKKQDRVAFRAGHTAFRGWALKPRAFNQVVRGQANLAEDDVKPNIQQKGVDIKIGLDIALLSARSVVDKIVLVTRDRDFIPAMKCARREGMAIAVASIETAPLPEHLEHADEAYIIHPQEQDDAKAMELIGS